MPRGPDRKPTDYELEVGRRIKAQRERLGLSQTELGKRLLTKSGKPTQRDMISRYEHGKELPQPQRRQVLADALQVSVESLFGAGDYEQTLSARVEAVEETMQALVAVLGVEKKVATALRAKRAADRRRRKGPSQIQRVAEEAPSPVGRSKRPSRPRRTGS